LLSVKRVPIKLDLATVDKELAIFGHHQWVQLQQFHIALYEEVIQVLDDECEL
jgi:hypothetical protein